MFEQYLNCSLKITTITNENPVTEYNMIILEIEDNLIKVQDTKGNTRVINTASPSFVEVRLQNEV